MKRNYQCYASGFVASKWWLSESILVKAMDRVLGIQPVRVISVDTITRDREIDYVQDMMLLKMMVTAFPLLTTSIWWIGRKF